jgi:DNA-binding transcriptional LysR family regulator
MKNTGHVAETRQLILFLSLIDTLSITRTAEDLGVSQSAVSHSLRKLRKQLGDELFVSSGRGIKATPYAQGIIEQVRNALETISALAIKPEFDPASIAGEIVIGANEYQRDVFLPKLFVTLRRQAPSLRFRVVSNPHDPLDIIRDDSVDLVLTPTPPQNNDIHHLRLTDDRQTVFFDSKSREKPITETDFLQADYIIPDILYDEVTGYIRRKFSPVKGHDIRPAIVVNTFAGIPYFLRNSQLLAPLPGKLEFMSQFAKCHVPGTYHPLAIHLCWHQRNHDSALHQWLIKQIKEITKLMN